MEQEPENREFRARFVLALLDRYSGFHDSADIDLAIVELEKTIPLPLDFPQRQGYLESFANAYRSRHRDTGNEGDIQRLIQLYKEIETTFPDDSVEKAIYTGQRMKYDETVSIEERDIALRQMEDALIPTPAHLQQYQVLLRLLSKQYYARWELTGDSKDLELAISKAKDHVSALPENDVSVSSAAVYEFLGHLLRKKGLRSENTAELMAACEQMEKALDAAPPNSIYRDLMVIKRAEYLAMLPFESKRREALLRTAVEKCDYLHTTWFNRLSNPAKSSLLMFISWHYYNLYVFTKHPADLEQALQYVEGKSDLESIEGGVDKTLLRWKGEMWLVKANETRVTDGTATRRGMQYLLQSSASDSSLPRERVLSAESIIRRANRTGSWELASKAADQIFPLLPLITSRDLSNEDKIYTLQDISTIASNACAAILMFRPPMEALLKLEVGRGIVMGDLINNSSDLSGLHQAHPDLAQEYERLRLQAFHSLKHEKWETGQTQLLNERRIVFQQLQQCERQIRAKAGFEGFLHPMNIRQMVDCAREGPIIVVNITCTSSDAIFVLSPTIIGHHRLNSMITRAVDKFREYLMRHAMTELYGDPWSYEKDPGARDLDSDLPREAYDNNLLSWLWYTCVKPILTSLASDGHISSGEEKSRVWWIGTGAAAGLPFHAAGDYSQSQENKGESCLDHVISSYTPTIKALHAVRAKAAAQQASRRVKERPSLLVATMPDTPGYGALHGVRREAQGISDAVGQSMEVKQLISPSTDEVLSQLQDCDLVHFACHGHSDPGNPANSHLLLQKHSDTGMVVDKLTVSKLLDTQTISRAWIAYLSACSTAEIRDRRLLDEGLHITSGFLMAGFTHVIGSLWPAEDEVCVHMATYFYKALITRYATATDLNRAVAEAVHDATLQIRRQYWHSPLSWALYTHVGAYPLGLQGPIHDVNAMEELLQELGFRIIRCCGEEATQAGIRGAWRRLINECEANDAVVIYYSGHGNLINASGFVGPGPPACYQSLCPMDYGQGPVDDFRGILDFEITFLVRQTTQKTENVTVIFDCCHSAHITRAPTVQSESGVQAIARSLPRMAYDITSYVRSLQEGSGRVEDSFLVSQDNPHAVRIFAAEVDEKAFEYRKEDGSWTGAMTEALIQEIRQLQGRGASWRTTIVKVRQQVQRRFKQRPQSHGPDQRLFFSTDMTPANILHLKIQEGRAIVGGGSVVGVRRGDVYTIQPFGDECINDERCLGTGTVVGLSGFQALLSLDLSPGCSIPQEGALAFTKAEEGLSNPSVLELYNRFADGPTMRLTNGTFSLRFADAHSSEDVSPQASANCVLSDGSIMLFTADDILIAKCNYTTEGILSTMVAAEQLAKAQRLLYLRCEESEEQLDHRLQVTLSRQGSTEGEAVSIEGVGIQEGEFLQIKLENLGSERVYVAVFDINVAGKITLLTKATPCGKPMSSRMKSTLGTNWLDQRGLGVHWPAGVARERPIPEHLVVVVADNEVDLRALETAENILKLRDVQRAPEIPHICWDVLHVGFKLLPTSAAECVDGAAPA
ncbi:hypothetical protein CBS115989_3958 [Aspergillus niger]|nr:hypothetical protein CBS115989_3958 [Aspergillus niger]KAI2848358.1 hypothetical protein CBS11350_2771 [Aspergillus niger]KAI2856415.1 hypothetical protein CBS11232_3766 [Aspergillus niger]KAI2876968.1 hypothetical protein CBS115988_4245 [Aspergillus niger]KAI2900174.1 hypothetical protein CBS11852_2968 [Aspergillus niger]